MFYIKYIVLRVYEWNDIFFNKQKPFYIFAWTFNMSPVLGCRMSLAEVDWFDNI